MNTIQIIVLVISLITGFYEVLARVIPTIKDYTILGVIIRILLLISNALNNGVKKNKVF